jgi:raffinose/stachyose/melibiose transport system substrate-binding protein
MKSFSLLAIALLATLVALDIGASPQQDTSTSTGPITLSVWTEAGQINDELKPMFDLYTAQHPNVTFRVSAFEMQNLNDIVPAALASGAEELDFLFLIGHADAQSFGEKGLLVDLTPYYEEFNWYGQQYPGAAKELTASDGNLYFMSIDFVMYGINYFNTAIFDSVGVEAPRELDDLLAISEKIKAADYATWAIGNKWQWTVRQLSEALSLRLIADDTYQTLVNWRNLSAQEKKDNLDLMKSEGVLEVFRLLRKMTEEGMFIDGFNTLDDGAARLAFSQERAAVYSSGSWAVGLLASEAPQIDLDYFLMPEHAGRTNFPASYANSLTIPAYTSGNKLDAILDFFNNMLEPEYAKSSFAAGLISSSTNFSEAEIAANVDPLTARLIKDNGEKGGVVTHFSNWPQEMAAGAWDIAAQEVTAFTMTPEEAVEFIHSAAKKTIE